MSGATHEVVSAYESAMSRGDRNVNSEEIPKQTSTKGRFLKWEIVEPQTENPHTLTQVTTTTVSFTIEICEPVKQGHHGIALFNHDRELVWGQATDDLQLSVGEHEFSYKFPMLPLRPGTYSWLVSLYGEEDLIDSWDCIPEMLVAVDSFGHPSDEWSGVLNIPSRLEIKRRG